MELRVCLVQRETFNPRDTENVIVTRTVVVTPANRAAVASRLCELLYNDARLSADFHYNTKGDDEIRVVGRRDLINEASIRDFSRAVTEAIAEARK